MLYKIINLKNQRLIGGLLILFIALFAVAFLTIASSYFNTTEINLAITHCYENKGEVVLEIHNNFTHAYSFECIRDTQ